MHWDELICILLVVVGMWLLLRISHAFSVFSKEFLAHCRLSLVAFSVAIIVAWWLQGVLYG